MPNYRLQLANTEIIPGLEDLFKALGHGDQGFEGTDYGQPGFDLNAYLEEQQKFYHGENLPKGYVPASLFWLLNDKKIPIGIGKLRHKLNKRLTFRGGHIGYYIAPAYRGQGAGKELLRLLLIEAKKLGIKRALLTVLSTNLASQKIIEYNGGVLEDERVNKDGLPFKRYWIEII
ncbi:GNAT family N-acetyltransferase [Candidatus Peregrinibacteria bacterium]|nr:GNAT family N-acetyltransferase [Candidatus Peregrinibacteria bacterium]